MFAAHAPRFGLDNDLKGHLYQDG